MLPRTDLRIRSAKPAEKAGKLTDGGGPYIEVAYGIDIDIDIDADGVLPRPTFQRGAVTTTELDQ